MYKQKRELLCRNKATGRALRIILNTHYVFRDAASTIIIAINQFTVASKQIPTISEEPVKSLGRWYDSSMKDTKRGQKTAELATEGLLAIY